LDQELKANFLLVVVAVVLGRRHGLATLLEKLHEVLVGLLQKVVHPPQAPFQAGSALLVVLPGSLMIL